MKKFKGNNIKAIYTRESSSAPRSAWTWELVLLLDVSKHQEPLLLLDVSTLQRIELHLDVCKL
jgi:hypothetical protein